MRASFVLEEGHFLYAAIVIRTLAQMVQKFFVRFFFALLRAPSAAAAPADELKSNSAVHHRLV
jgi:hypothetical protein